MNNFNQQKILIPILIDKKKEIWSILFSYYINSSMYLQDVLSAIYLYYQKYIIFINEHNSWQFFLNLMLFHNAQRHYEHWTLLKHVSSCK